MPALSLFEFTDEFIANTRKSLKIPVHFYNKDGQILIYKKEIASRDEIERLFRFIGQGIYYNNDDKQKLNIKPSSEIPEGLSNTKLINGKYTKDLTHNTEELFNELKRASFTSMHAKETSEKLESLFTDFSRQADAMTGLVNVIDHMQISKASFDVKTAIKRTVIAMALKTRGMHAGLNYKDRKQIKEQITNLMLSSLLCDIGCYQMEMPKDNRLTINQMDYIKNHPIMSYLMLAHEPELNFQIKSCILTHHRAKQEDMNNNNYPKIKNLIIKLSDIAKKFKDIPNKKIVVDNIIKQIKIIKSDQQNIYDSNVLAIASEFASLTSQTPWRPAFTPERAVKMIINNSYYSYTSRTIKEFLDYVAISLCNNRMIFNKGDYIITASDLHSGKSIFEVCQINNINRFQSRPGITRMATVEPETSNIPKLMLEGFDLNKIKLDTRKAHYELTMDDTRRIVYFIDPIYNSDLFNAIKDIK